MTCIQQYIFILNWVHKYINDMKITMYTYIHTIHRTCIMYMKWNKVNKATCPEYLLRLRFTYLFLTAMSRFLPKQSKKKSEYKLNNRVIVDFSGWYQLENPDFCKNNLWKLYLFVITRIRYRNSVSTVVSRVIPGDWNWNTSRPKPDL